MLVSIVVPALNEEGEIAATISALQELEGEKEIVVVDGGSTDRTMTIAHSFGVRVMSSVKGRGAQMQAGAVDARGGVLWFVHADTKPPRHALQEIARALENPAVVGGNFGLVFDGSTRAARQLTTIYPLLRQIGLCYGDSGIFLRRKVYERIGGFKALALFEDLDLIRRLRRAGKFAHLPCSITTSSRRFENRNFAVMWAHWTTLQVLYWCGVPPNRLASWYSHARRNKC